VRARMETDEPTLGRRTVTSAAAAGSPGVPPS
jgi:hypothetical protein